VSRDPYQRSCLARETPEDRGEPVGRIVEEKNTHLQSSAEIKKLTILPADFTPEGASLRHTKGEA
jgi:hypothetical protein